jgi:hypothetical protein
LLGTIEESYSKSSVSEAMADMSLPTIYDLYYDLTLYLLRSDFGHNKFDDIMTVADHTDINMYSLSNTLNWAQTTIATTTYRGRLKVGYIIDSSRLAYIAEQAVFYAKLLY